MDAEKQRACLEGRALREAEGGEAETSKRESRLQLQDNFRHFGIASLEAGQQPLSMVTWSE